MKYNFIRYGETYPLFETKDIIDTIAKGNIIEFENTRYEIKLVENILERDETVYSYAKLKEVNVYIKEKTSFNYC